MLHYKWNKQANFMHSVELRLSLGAFGRLARDSSHSGGNLAKGP